MKADNMEVIHEEASTLGGVATCTCVALLTILVLRCQAMVNSFARLYAAYGRLIHKQSHVDHKHDCQSGCKTSCRACATATELKIMPQPTLVPPGLAPAQLPRHVAIISDGNSRWAKAKGLSTAAGHEQGASAAKAAVEAAADWGISVITIFGFSIENFKRVETEVELLFNLLDMTLRNETQELAEKGVRIHFMSQQRHHLPVMLQQVMAECEAATAHNNRLLLNIAWAYGGQHDLVKAAQELAMEVQQGRLQPRQITADKLSKHLSSCLATSAAGPPDLLIRTSGEQRLSNFMLWECAYSELYFPDVLWPDFGRQHFEEALQQYAKRQRRFGARA